MTMNEQHLSLHPAADVFLNQLLLDISKENDKLDENSGRLQSSCDFLGEIKFSLGGSGRVVSVSLKESFILNDFNGLPCLCVNVDTPPCRLSEFRNGRVSMSGQIVGRFPGVSEPILHTTDDNGVHIIHMKLIFTAFGMLEGELCGLDDDDLSRFGDNSFGDEHIMTFLRTGQGLRNSNEITFCPRTVIMVITPELHETIGVLGPFPRFETAADSCCCYYEGPAVDPNDCIKYPPLTSSDESRLTIIDALGCTDSQKEVVEENLQLKRLCYRLSKIEERIDTVKIYHVTHEPTTISLRDGKLAWDLDGSPTWRISLGKLCVVANNIHLLEIVVSGIRSDVKDMEVYVAENVGGALIAGNFSMGGKILGRLEPESTPDMNRTDFLEMTSRALGGERSFPPGFTLRSCHVDFPLESVCEGLTLLQVKISAREIESLTQLEFDM